MHTNSVKKINELPLKVVHEGMTMATDITSQAKRTVLTSQNIDSNLSDIEYNR